MNANSNSIFKLSRINYLIVLIASLGTLVRLIYGWKFKPWILSPDHMAWNLVIESGEWSYSDLIHYPHEGGSILITLFARLISIFTSHNALMVATIAIDFIIRIFQLHITQRVLSNKTMIVFGIWTIFCGSAFIPWGTVNFGLHYISSIFPFLFLYSLHFHNKKNQYFSLTGIGIGLAIWFSYINILILPSFLLVMILNRNSFRNWGKFSIPFLLILGIHLIIRTTFDSGFKLDDQSISSIRGIDFKAEIQWSRLYEFFYNPFADVFISGLSDLQSMEWMKFIPVILLISGFGLFLTNVDSKAVRGGILLFVISFIVIYSLSPFYFNGSEYGGSKIGSYVSYRHLTYLLPLMFAIAFHGFLQFTRKHIAVIGVGLILVSSCFFTIQSFFEKPFIVINQQATGWVIGKKFAHNSNKTTLLIDRSKLNKKELFEGVGWAMSSVIFEDVKETEDDKISARSIELRALIHSYPTSVRPYLIEGAKIPFGFQSTDRYDKSVWDKVSPELDQDQI